MARLLDAKAGRLAETKTHILCPRPASNRQKLKYSVGLAGEVPEVQNQRRGRIDFGGRSRTFRTLVGTFQNMHLCVFDYVADDVPEHKIWKPSFTQRVSGFSRTG